MIFPLSAIPPKMEKGNRKMFWNVVQIIFGALLGVAALGGIVYWTIFDLPYRK